MIAIFVSLFFIALLLRSKLDNNLSECFRLFQFRTSIFFLCVHYMKYITSYIWNTILDSSFCQMTQKLCYFNTIFVDVQPLMSFFTYSDVYCELFYYYHFTQFYTKALNFFITFIIISTNIILSISLYWISL